MKSALKEGQPHTCTTQHEAWQVAEVVTDWKSEGRASLGTWASPSGREAVGAPASESHPGGSLQSSDCEGNSLGGGLARQELEGAAAPERGGRGRGAAGT